VLSLSGRKGYEEITVDAAELDCVDHTLTKPNRICSLPWPAAKWPLEPGQRYFLAVAARTGVAADLRSSETSALRTLAGDAAGAVEADVAEIDALDLGAVTQELRLASLYAEQGLYGDAIDAYEQALAAQPTPEIYVALGDVYSQVALYRWAFEAYQNALDLLSEGEDDPAVRAAAEFGIGRVYYTYADNFAEAAKHFETALHLYEAADAPKWSQAAQRALEEARERTP
jgi:tetratricopeptide (TPR) repeat protein